MTSSPLFVDSLDEHKQPQRQRQQQQQQQRNELMDPFDLCPEGRLPKPKSLSPSSISEFKSCPQSYLFRYLLGIRQPPNEALARGTFCHAALDLLFDLQPDERTASNLHNLFRSAWSKERLSDEYRGLFEIDPNDDGGGDGRASDEDDRGTTKRGGRNVEAEIAWGKSSLTLLDNYLECEDPTLIRSPNPLAREIWVSNRFAVSNDENEEERNNDDGDDDDTFLVRGIVDRIDLVRGPALRIVDYKTGKCPDFKYSPATNARIANETFFQLKIYALLLREMMKGQELREQREAEDDENDDEVKTIEEARAGKLPINLRFGAPVRHLRFVYLTSADEGRPAKFLNLDLGETDDERNAELDRVRRDLSELWTDINRLVRTNNPRAFRHCDRTFCSCHKVRPWFVPGTVWERDKPV